MMKRAVFAQRFHMPSLLLLLAVVAMPTSTASAQIPANVRVVNRTPVVQWRYVRNEVVMNADPGTLLEVLDKEGDWYWVVTPRDNHGTRKPGWVAVRNVESVTGTATAGQSPASSVRDQPGFSVSTPTTIGAEPAAIASGAGVTVESGTTLQVPRKDFSFEDVHFGRNRYSLGPEEMKILDMAANALKDDPSLKVNVEGYTCNLGTAAYNLALGDRRANAVRDYLVSKGVPAERLHTMSFGEENPKYDNSTEDTRKLNRRVALVPNLQP
jgi:outer membrane protein OmpA-like peptidoglycan-associated protein